MSKYLLQISPTTLRKIERGESKATKEMIFPLSAYLQIDYKYLQIKYLSGIIYEEVVCMDYASEALRLVQKRIEKKGNRRLSKAKKSILLEIKQYFEKQPIAKAWIFGSFARNEESQDSDIDLLIRFIQPHKVDLFEYVGMKQDLEDITGRAIDLVEEGTELRQFSPLIHQEKQLIYERQVVQI